MDTQDHSVKRKSDERDASILIRAILLSPLPAGRKVRLIDRVLNLVGMGAKS